MRIPAPSRTAAICFAGIALFVSGNAQAFPYVMRRGETLAEVAQRFYGKIELERVLVPANALDNQHGERIVAGMRLEIPANAHHTVVAGDSWENVADRYLGSKTRGEALAMLNRTSPWIPPERGREIQIPFNLRYVVRPGDNILGVAYRFLPKRDDAYLLDRYNELHGQAIEAGDVILVPLVDLDLTDEGKRAAKEGAEYETSQSEGEDRDAQDVADSEMPKLFADVRQGRYVEAVARASALLGSGNLTESETAKIQRNLLEAYVALDADQPAREACRAWREADSDASLDPIELSPKILKACAALPGTREKR